LASEPAPGEKICSASRSAPASSRRRAKAAQAVAARKARRYRSTPANGGFSRKTTSNKARLAPAKKAASQLPPVPIEGFIGGRAHCGNICCNSGLDGKELGAASRRDRRRDVATGASPRESA
jgi:hypothetical protein